MSTRITLYFLFFFISLNLFSQSTKSVEELNNEIKIAIENQDYAKADSLKKEIVKLEERDKELKKLEEDKQIAIFQEKYEEVILIEKKINDVKTGKNTNNNLVETTNQKQSVSQIPAFNSAFEKAYKLEKKESKSLSEVDYKDKVMGNFSMGFRFIDENKDLYGESDLVAAMQFSNHRWWVNKSIVGGTFFDIGYGDYFSIQGGGQFSAILDFESIVVPYTSLAMGLGLNDDGDIYFPVALKLGSHLFFNTQRSIGAIVEINYYVNNEYMPIFRFGLAWTRIKRRAK